MSSFTIRYISYSQKSTVASFSHCGSYIELLEQGSPHRTKNIHVRKFRGCTEQCLLDMAAYAVRVYFKKALGRSSDTPAYQAWDSISVLILDEMTSYAESCVNSQRIDLCARIMREIGEYASYRDVLSTSLYQRMESVVERFKKASDFNSVIDELVKDI